MLKFLDILSFCDIVFKDPVLSQDAFGKALLASGIPLPLMTKDWFKDPTVDFEGGKKSLFDLLEDLDAAACIKKCKDIAVANK